MYTAYELLRSRWSSVARTVETWRSRIRGVARAELRREQDEIKYMTDDHLIREMMVDPLLSKYSVLVIDEAHDQLIYRRNIRLLRKIREKTGLETCGSPRQR